MKSKYVQLGLISLALGFCMCLIQKYINFVPVFMVGSVFTILTIDKAQDRLFPETTFKKGLLIRTLVAIPLFLLPLCVLAMVGYIKF